MSKVVEKFDLLLHTGIYVALTNDLCGIGIKQFAARNTKIENEDRPRVSKTSWKVAVIYIAFGFVLLRVSLNRNLNQFVLDVS